MSSGATIPTATSTATYRRGMLFGRLYRTAERARVLAEILANQSEPSDWVRSEAQRLREWLQQEKKSFEDFVSTRSFAFLSEPDAKPETLSNELDGVLIQLEKAAATDGNGVGDLAEVIDTLSESLDLESRRAY